MANGKKPFQFGPRTPEQMQRHNGQANQSEPAQPQPTPEQMLRMRAMARLEILPPYQSTTPHEMLFVENGQETVKTFKGMTKREHLVSMYAAAAIEKDGLPLRDEEMASIVRRAIIMSEITLQTISSQRGKDMQEVIEQLKLEDAQAAAEKTGD